ncbi:MAG: CAP domain-containing protein [Burkholderiales bacterium]|nr:CAP domain-containing protein [Burkholderiales bacterium]
MLIHSFALAGGIFKASPCQEPALREAILQQVNTIRSRGYNCGGQAFGSAQAVNWNSQLVGAASGHSADMAENNYFDHQNLRGQKAQHRVDAVGYKWRGVAENIAAGQFSTRTVMQGWMDSPGHCKNIMDPSYNEIGVACIEKPGSYYGEYWTMVLARRR